MRYRVCILLLALSALSLESSVLANEPNGSGRRDNSGRQLAIVVPGIPSLPSAVRVPVATAATRASHSLTSTIGPHSEARGSSAHPVRIKGVTRSFLSTPVELSPELKEAAGRSAQVAQGFSRAAARKFADVSAWIATIWKQMNETPRITPNTSPTLREPPVGPMRPLYEPQRPHELFYTNEQRIKTVVSR